MAGPVIKVEITGDAKGAKKATDDATGFFESFGKKTSGILVGVGAAITTFGIQAGAGLISAAGGWINLAKEADIYGKKADTVFGTNAGDVKAWADKVNESFGLSDEKVVGLAASMGDLLVPLGFTREAAADMSKKTIELSGALSAWSGGTIGAAEVSDILTKAMLGETDGLKALGISISAEEVARKAATMAAEGQTFATEEQAKAAATQALIFEKSTDAQTAWADGTMDATKQQNEATAAWEDAKVSLGQGLLPIVQAATKWFVNSFLPAAREIVAEFKENWPAIKETIQDVFANVMAAWETFGKPVFEALVAAGQAVVAWVQDNWPAIQTTITDVLTAIQTITQTIIDFWMMIWRNFGDQIMAFVTATFDTIKVTIESVMQIIRGIIQTITALIHGEWGAAWDGIKLVLAGVWDAIVAIVQGAIETVRAAISVAMELVAAAWGVVWEGIKSAVSGAWDGIKTLVSGGVTAVIDFVGSIPGKVLELAGTMFKPIGDAFTDAKDFVSDGVGKIFDVIGSIPGGVVTALGDGFSGIWNAFKKVVNQVIDAWNGLELPSITVGGWDPPGPGSFPSFTTPSVGTPNIPRLHTGGIVPGVPGSDVLALLQAGERVTPRNQAGAGMITITVNAGMGANGNQIGNEIVRHLKVWERSNGPILAR